ncbi:mechanosensitive ion channel family protein [Myxococcus sp. AM009]|uniref:mechanosensitive ion channel family protein n=1 Tax=unclassified Myxococcus TaxID=2648731 RepID=UPI001595D33E|nr:MULTISPECIES: mechanosensitive ion channel family protein [unclassified Myxococcus]NVI97698.1 mechanosensitive ion channel family protein [Myxococcus sp. AM009]NVJ15912.1 mechanosensitive ion channel family protein [Myxococcus sp. AM010]
MMHRDSWTLRALVLGLGLLWSLPAAALNVGLGPPPPSVDRRTPQAAVQGFLAAAHRGDYTLAAHYLDLDYIPRAQQAERGVQLARALKFVLDRKLPVNVGSLSKEPEGDPADARYDQLGTIPLQGSNVPIRVQRVPSEGGLVWVFNESTVRQADPLFAEHGPRLVGFLPAFFFKDTVLGLEPWQWLGLLVTVLGSLGLSVLLERLVLALARRVARWTRFTWEDDVVSSGKGPVKLLTFSALLVVGTLLLRLPRPAQGFFMRVAYSLSVVALAWAVLRILHVSVAFVQSRVSSEMKDATRARSVSTQLVVLRAIFEVATYVIAAALLLIQFEVVRNVGVSLLASAGIAGLVLGLAAQKSIGTLLAGIQLSITQPISIGDTLITEGEYGTVEKITLTYVVLRTWDQRRLVIPIVQFLDKPFQNWSKGNPEMLGPVILQVDYQTDIDALRAELRRILENEGKSMWDGRVASVVVMDVLDRTLTVRALVSVSDFSTLFDLRALVREKLVAFLRAHPLWLPVTRTEARPFPPPELESTQLAASPDAPPKPPRA